MTRPAGAPTKLCTKCGEVKPLSELYRMKGMRDGHRSDCKTCNLAAKKARYDADPASHIARVQRWQKENAERLDAGRRRRRQRDDWRRLYRAGHLRRTFGITLEEYEERLGHQGGGCAICGDPPPVAGSLHVDHDHETGRVRALLCMRCNNALGLFRDDPAILERALTYVAARRRAAAMAAGAAGRSR